MKRGTTSATSATTNNNSSSRNSPRSIGAGRVGPVAVSHGSSAPKSKAAGGVPVVNRLQHSTIAAQVCVCVCVCVCNVAFTG